MSSKSRWQAAATAASTAASLSSKTKARKAQRGVPLNMMVVGQSGLGKSTFVRTLVEKELIPSKEYDEYNDLSEKTVELNTYNEDIDADGQKVILTIVDAPGFGDNINNSRSFVKILEYTENQHKRFLAEETRVQRNARFQDTRVHVILYFIPPTGHYLRDIDIVFMKQLGRRTNILPVIGKSDTMLPSELREFKKRVMEDIKKHEIPIFDFPVNSEDDDDVIQENNDFRSLLPFSIIASDELHEVDGQEVPARQYPWGLAQVANDLHSDFGKLKFVLLISHLEVLKEVTNDVHYENYRQECLSKGGSLDSAKIEEELLALDKSEKDQRDKLQAERDRRIALKKEKSKGAPAVRIERAERRDSGSVERKSSTISTVSEDLDEDGKKKEKKEKKEKSTKPKKSLVEEDDDGKKKEKKEKKEKKKKEEDKEDEDD